MIKVPVDIVSNIHLDGDLCGMSPEDIPREGFVELSIEQFAGLFSKAIQQAGCFWEEDDGLETLLSGIHEYNEALCALVLFCNSNVQLRGFFKRTCRFCGSESTKFVEISSGKHQIACIDCGARGRLADTMEQADWSKAEGV
jgi:hypothetical protein